MADLLLPRRARGRPSPNAEGAYQEHRQAFCTLIREIRPAPLPTPLTDCPTQPAAHHQRHAAMMTHHPFSSILVGTGVC